VISKKILTALLLIFICVSALSATSYTVVGYTYKINGDTEEFAIDNLINPHEKEFFLEETELREAIERKQQILWNTVLFDRADVKYSIASSVDTDHYVIIEVEVTDANSSIIFPYPKFDSNYGFVFGLRYKEKNLLGRMATMDISLDIMQQGKSFKTGDYSFDIPIKGLVIKDAELSAKISGDIDLLHTENSFVRFELDEKGWKIGTASIVVALDLRYQYGDNTESKYKIKLAETGWQAGPGKIHTGFELEFKPTLTPIVGKFALDIGYTDIQVGTAKLAAAFSGLYYPVAPAPYMDEESYHKITFGVSEFDLDGFVLSEVPVLTFQPGQSDEIKTRLYSIENTITLSMPDGKLVGKKLNNNVYWRIYGMEDSEDKKSSTLVTNFIKTNTSFSFNIFNDYTNSYIFKTWRDDIKGFNRFDLDVRAERTFKFLDDMFSISPIITLYNRFFVGNKVEYSPLIEFAISASADGGEINRVNSGEDFFAFRDNFRQGLTYSLQAAGRYIPTKRLQFFLRGEMIVFPFYNSFFNPSIRVLGMASTGEPRIWFNSTEDSDPWYLRSEADSDYLYSYNAYRYKDYTFSSEGLNNILRGILLENELVQAGGYMAKAVLAANINLTTALFNFEDMGHTYISPFYDFALFMSREKFNIMHSVGIEGIAIVDSLPAYPIRVSVGFNASDIIAKLRGRDVELEYEVFVGMGWYY